MMQKKHRRSLQFALFLLCALTPSVLQADERTRTGSLVSYDPQQETVVLLQQNRITYSYRVTDRTVYKKNRLPAIAQDFVTGEKVVLTIRLNRDATSFEALGVFDPPSYRQLKLQAKQPLPIVLKEILAGSLTGSYTGSERDIQGHELRYLFDNQTHWIAKDKVGRANDFQLGHLVWIAPRSVQGGDVVARVVADREDSLTKAYRVPAQNTRGTLISYLQDTNSLQLRTKDGETHTYHFATPPELFQRAKPISQETLLAAIPNRFPVCVRILRTPSSEFVVRITIEKTERHRRMR